MGNSYLILIAAVVGYFIFLYVFKKVFYNGRLDKDNWMVYNLSSFAEYFMTIFFFAFAYVSLHGVIKSNSVWYVRILEWIWELVWILFFISNGMLVFINRKNYISIKGNKIKYKTRKDEGLLTIKSYCFDNNILEIEDCTNEENVIKKIDLNSNGLKGFKPKLEIYMAQNFENKSK